MRKIYLIAAVISLPVLISISCSKDGGGGASVDCSTVTNKAFAADVNPLIQSTCATTTACHSAGSSNGPGALTSYNQVFAARSSIRSAIISGLMPPMLTLSSSQKNSIICWIDSGAPNN